MTREKISLKFVYNDGWGGKIVQKVTFDEESPENYLMACAKFLGVVFCEDNIDAAILAAADEINREQAKDKPADPEGRYTYGGNGSHWEGCEETHWDCRIKWLEERIDGLLAEIAAYEKGLPEVS